MSQGLESGRLDAHLKSRVEIIAAVGFFIPQFTVNLDHLISSDGIPHIATACRGYGSDAVADARPCGVSGLGRSGGGASTPGNETDDQLTAWLFFSSRVCCLVAVLKLFAQVIERLVAALAIGQYAELQRAGNVERVGSCSTIFTQIELCGLLRPTEV